MEVILKQDVDRLGKAGSVVKVKEGFARNFLLPNGLAIPVTAGNLKKVEEEKKAKALQAEKVKQEAEKLKQKLEGLSVTMPVLIQEDESLYGSITSTEIAKALKEEGVELDKALIILESPIKTLGIYEVPVKLHPEVSATVKLWIVKK